MMVDYGYSKPYDEVSAVAKLRVVMLKDAATLNNAQ